MEVYRDPQHNGYARCDRYEPGQSIQLASFTDVVLSVSDFLKLGTRERADCLVLGRFGVRGNPQRHRLGFRRNAVQGAFHVPFR